MPPSRILTDDPSDFPSMPSMPTLRAGGDVNALGRIDHYDLLGKLGGGGFGVVYLALDTASGVEVALKTLHPLLKSNAEEMDVLREKFRLVSRLSHPNIASALVLHPVRDVNIWDETARAEMRLSPGDSVMVMRYAPGTTLSKWRRQFPDGIVPLDQALDIARQIASALDYAHGERIVHRDIKPANIMVETLESLTGLQDRQDEQDTSGVASAQPGSPVNPENPGHPVSKLRVRILDFGLAAEIRSSMSRVSTEQGDTSGTRPYMAPEQWLGKKQDGRTDQYALACVLYELLSGAPPFAGVFETGDPAIMKDAVVRDAPEEIKDVPASINAALLRALAKAPKDRFPSCVAFVENCHTSRPRRDEDVAILSSAGPDGGTKSLNDLQIRSARRLLLWFAVFGVAVSGVLVFIASREWMKDSARLSSVVELSQGTPPFPVDASSPLEEEDKKETPPFGMTVARNTNGNTPCGVGKPKTEICSSVETARSSDGTNSLGERPNMGLTVGEFQNLANQVLDGLPDDPVFAATYKKLKSRYEERALKDGSETTLPLVEFEPFVDLTYRNGGANVALMTGHGRSDGRMTRPIVDALSEGLLEKGLFRVGNRFNSPDESFDFGDPDLRVSGKLSCGTLDGIRTYTLHVSFVDSRTGKSIWEKTASLPKQRATELIP